MLYIKRLFKLSIFITLLAVISYVGLWAYSGYKLKQKITEFAAQTNENFKLLYSDMKLSGFPFKFKIRFSNLSLQVHPKKMNFINDMTYEIVKLETNILFNHVKLSILGKATSDTAYNGKITAFDTLYKSGCYIKLVDSNPVNTAKVVKSLYKNENFTDFKMKEFSFIANDLVNIDRLTKAEISNASSTIQILLDRPSDIITNTSVKIDSTANLLPGYKELFQNLLNFQIPISKIALNADVSYTSKKEEDRSLIPFIDLKTIKIDLDETKFSFAGLVQDDKSGRAIINVDFTASEWNKLLENLMMENILSKERYSVILALLSDITGDDFPSNVIEFKISNESGAMTVGKRPVYSLSNRLQQFIMSK